MFSFFFSSRRRHTRWPRDWSSDVCSSDLGYVMLIRLKTEGLISNKEYRDLKPEFSFYDVSGKGSDSGDPYFNQIVRKGKLYLRTAFQSYFDNKIHVVVLANLTGWKVPN